MSRALSALVARTTRVVVPVSADTDGELLRRFARTRDEAAFTELVRRLGPLVLGACRRVARDTHAAEDAFQAAFLVLVRRAADVRPAEAVRGYLYGVAVRCAQEARAVNARRRQRETPVPQVPDRAGEQSPPPDADALAALDEELAQLPEHLRAAVVLCELDGWSRKTAAERLGIPEGTLSSRLAKARKLLADRLRRRGVVFTAGALAALGQTAVSPLLLARTAALAAPGAVVPATVAEIAQKGWQAMTRLKIVSLSVVVAVGVVACVAFGIWTSRQESVSKPAPRAIESEVTQVAPQDATKSTLLFGVPGRLAVKDHTGPRTVHDPRGKNPLSHFRLSPDGTRFAFLRYKVPDGPRGRDDIWDHTGWLIVCNVGEVSEGTNTGLSCDSFAWSPNGEEIAFTDRGPSGAGRRDRPRKHGVFNLKTKTSTALALPGDHDLCDWSRDGNYFLTEREGKNTEPLIWLGPHALYLMNRDGSEAKVLTDPGDRCFSGRLSQDGSKLLYARYDVTDREHWDHQLWVLDIASGKRQEVAGTSSIKDGRHIYNFCWSPSGKQIAYTHNASGKWPENKLPLVVCDPDGRNATVTTQTVLWAITTTLVDVDWR